MVFCHSEIWSDCFEDIVKYEFFAVIFWKSIHTMKQKLLAKWPFPEVMNTFGHKQHNAFIVFEATEAFIKVLNQIRLDYLSKFNISNLFSG